MKIVVLGAGVIGLTTARKLQDANVGDVKVISSQLAGDQSSTLVSDIACALWGPMWTYSAAAPIGYRDRQARWARESFKAFTNIYRERPQAGIASVRHSELYAPGELPPVDAGEYPYLNSIESDVDPSNLGPTLSALGLRCQSYMTYVIPSSQYCRWLRKDFIDRGGQISATSMLEHEDLFDLDTDLLVNCTGLASQYLFADGDLYPVKGVVLLYPASNQITSSIAYGEYCVIPRNDALVVGSLYRSSSQDPMATENEIEEIKHFASQMLPRHNVFETAPIVLVGLRPCRNMGVRVELESGLLPYPIIHNYGHGGAGYSLSWGCAQNVVEIVRNECAIQKAN